MKHVATAIRIALVLFALFCIADGSTGDAIALLLLVVIWQLARLPHAPEPTRYVQLSERAYNGPNNPLR